MLVRTLSLQSPTPSCVFFFVAMHVQDSTLIVVLFVGGSTSSNNNAKVYARTYVSLLLRGTLVNRTYGIHKTYIFNHCYEQCLVLLTMAPRNTTVCCYIVTTEGTSTHFFYIRSHRTVSARTFCPDPSLFVPQTDRSKQQIDTNIR